MTYEYDARNGVIRNPNGDGTFHGRETTPAADGTVKKVHGEWMIREAPRFDARPAGTHLQDNLDDYGHPLDGSPDGGLDFFVETIRDGHLSRGVPGAGPVDSIRAWRWWSGLNGRLNDDARYQSFSDGVGGAAVCLSLSKLREQWTISDEDARAYATGLKAAPVHLMTSAEQILQTKRVTKEDRERWIASVHQSVDPENWRGQWVAAAALSKTDEWWGFRDNLERTVLG
ncbi:hypothetical protein [Leifsonia sp. Leaf264]|uniref:hypothetical protein n=1 Tax=Leifsonia sp. Leaf264 TaxID=1736314 RepID=UPI0006F81574|nr:hypothetical protein [Leifsonia sp. Leaf264]KQO98666.1 hypothetical protein ASF30_11430 [Leifsonia sp. Leaf264]